MEVFMRELLQSTKVRLFDEGGLKDLFDHVRNLLMATLIIAAGSFVTRQAGTIEPFGILYDEFAGYMVLAIGAILGVLNALNGLHQLNKQQLHIGIRIVVIVLYVVGTVRLIQLVVVLRTG
jgi:hypothetical protein